MRGGGEWRSGIWGSDGGLGIRRSYMNESVGVAQELLHTELLLTYLQQANPPAPGKAEAIRGYRGGDLPNERRGNERGLRASRVRRGGAPRAPLAWVDVGLPGARGMARYPRALPPAFH